MTYKSSETIMVNLLKQAVESEGCHLSEVDLENLVIKVNGPDERRQQLRQGRCGNS